MLNSETIQGTHSDTVCLNKYSYLQALQLFDQRPAAYEALVEQGQDGRTFQDCLPESSPRTYRRQMDISAVTGVSVTVLHK